MGMKSARDQVNRVMDSGGKRVQINEAASLQDAEVLSNGSGGGGRDEKRRRTERKPPPPPSSSGAMIPSYLRARFSDRGSSLRDQPSSRRALPLEDGILASLPAAPSPLKPKASKSAGKAVKIKEIVDEASEKAELLAGDSTSVRANRRADRRRRGDADLDLMDNNVLLFGRWYRTLAVEGPPQLSHLRDFVMDRKAYWGDEIALRVFAGEFKVVLVVVLQAEERLQCVFPPCGGAKSVTYIVLTHRGSVPHYRGVSVTGKHVLNLDEKENTDPQGGSFLTTGMIARLLEDCPDGWEDCLTPAALSFIRLGKRGAESSGGSGSPLPAQSQRRHVVRNANTLKEVKSERGIQQLHGEGAAVDAYIIEGFPAGSHFVERIACSPSETNPRFSLSKTPGDGDCLFYAMADVANEVRDGICPGSPRQNDGQYSVDNLRNMVSQSLTENELAFFRAANDFQ